jgi:GH35 family endo-1,4-beta-xylanase
MLQMLACAVVLLFCLQALAADLPAGGKVVFPSDPPAGPYVKHDNNDKWRRIKVEGQPFTEAIEVDVDRTYPEVWDVALYAPMNGPIAKGDVVHVRIWGRNEFSMTGAARIGVCTEINKEPWTKELDTLAAFSSEWQPVDLPFVSHSDWPAGGWQLSIRLAFATQKVQIGAIEVRNYGRSVKIDSLPRTRMGYTGMEPNAQWRKDALARIEKIRKSDLKVKVIDSAGKPVAGAQVQVDLKRHAFGFGTCISPTLLAQTPDGQRYRETVQKYFNHVVIENNLKWPTILQEGYGRADAMVDWLNAHDISVRGHCLVWPGDRWLPKQVLTMKEQPEALRKLIADHITTTVTRYKGKLIDWDVINEPRANHLLMDWLGNDVMVDWYKLAHAADPDVKLYLNDYAILASGDHVDTRNQKTYFDTLKMLIDKGAPIHGVGFQGHFASNITSPENMLKILDRFAKLGLRMKVTEMDIALDDETLRANYLRDTFIVLFSHPQVDAIMQWGFWEGSHWIPNAALFRKDWTLRPHGQAFVDLMQQWSTHETGTTNPAGEFSARGFLGTYAVQASVDGQPTQSTFKLDAQGGQCVVRLNR